MNRYADLLLATVLIAAVGYTVLSYVRLGRAIKVWQERMRARSDAAVPAEQPVSEIPVAELHEIADSLRERAAGR